MTATDTSMDTSGSDSGATSGDSGTGSTRRTSQRQLKYNFRTSSVLNRQEIESKKNQPRTPKPKSRPPPLSKYRRKTANARERVRMQEVNEAFDQLRNVIPQYPAEKGKITKITTLTLALNYIKALREVLGYQNEPEASGSTMDTCSSPSGSSQGDYGEAGMSSPSQGTGSGLDSEGESIPSS